MVDLPDDDGLVGVFNNITSTMLMMDSDVELSVSTEAMGSRLYCTAVFRHARSITNHSRCIIG